MVMYNVVYCRFSILQHFCLHPCLILCVVFYFPLVTHSCILPTGFVVGFKERKMPFSINCR